MPFVPAPGIITMATIMTWNGERVENTFNYHSAGTINSTLLQAMAQTYVNWFTAHESDFSNTVGLELIYLRDLTSQTSTTFEFIPPTSTDGTRTSPTLPNNCTLAIKRQTGLAGRQNRGRVFHVGLTEDLLSGVNTVAQSQAALLATHYSSLLASQLTDNAVTEVIYHRKLGTGTTVLGYVCSDFVLDSQRRRLPGHNRHR